jgi:hypothetical protein
VARLATASALVESFNTTMYRPGSAALPAVDESDNPIGASAITSIATSHLRIILTASAS